MQAGRLNTRITIQRRGTFRDDFGQPIEAWSDVALVWAHVVHENGLSRISADADTSVVKASIRIRRRPGIDAGMRVLVAGAVYEIDAVQPDLIAREHIDLVCRRLA